MYLRRFRRGSVLLLCFLLPAVSFGVVKPGGAHHRPKSSVHFSLQVEDWATTQSARVLVTFHGTMGTQDLSTLQARVTEQLAQLSKSAQWHMTHFQRQETRSELETVIMVFESRLPASELPLLRETAKKISKPGATFSISQIDFTPSLAESQATQAALRTKLYARVQEELERLRHAYPGYPYRISRIDFTGPARVVPTAAIGSLQRLMRAAPSATEAGSSPMADAAVMPVSQKVQLSAEVTLAVMNNHQEDA